MIYELYDIKPSSKILLKYSADEFVLLKNGILANLSDGTCHLKIVEQYNEVKKVFDSKGNILAIRMADTLQKYDATQHDEKIIKIKRKNNLLSYDELVVEFMRQKINHSNLLLVDYCKINGSYKSDIGNITCPTFRGAVMKATQITGKGKININLVITKYLVNKKENLYLYRYTASFLFI